MPRFRIALLITFIFIVALRLSATESGGDWQPMIDFAPSSGTQIEASLPTNLHDLHSSRQMSESVISEKASDVSLNGEPVTDEAKEEIRPAVPDSVRGLYLSGWAAGVRLSETVDYMQRHDLNTIVIDIKDTDGLLSFALPGTLADELGANAFKMGSAGRVTQALDHFNDAGIYVIGRLALFQDNFLPHRHPEWALRHPTGELWRDPSGSYWLDPAQPEVLDYHVEIAIAAARLGFDEIQFDYVRYPGQRVAGYNDGPKEQRIATITEFVTTARTRIQEHLDLPISAAIYGIIAVNEADHNLGQDLGSLTQALDYVSPMFYPSHYLPGDFGLPDPNAEPYKTMFASTAAALARTSESEWSQLRPWIQSFFGYDKTQVEEQIRALKDLGIDSFFVWNPSGRYVSGVDYHLKDEGEGRLANSPFRPILYPLMSPAEGIFVPDPALKLPTHVETASRDAQGDWHVQAHRQRDGYRVELWRGDASASMETATAGFVRHGEHTGRQGDRKALGERIVTVQRSATTPSKKTFTPARAGDRAGEARNVATVVPDENGVALVWDEEGYEWHLWAPSLTEALAAKRSLQSVPAALF